MDKDNPLSTGKLRGRPSKFNHENALKAALNVFWAQGYEGTSMTDLTEALGINKPSIYAAFGNKEALFKKALSKYASETVNFLPDAIKAPTAKKVVELFLCDAAEFLTNPDTPQGCLIVQGALACSKDAEPIKQLLIEYRKNLELTLVDRFELAKNQGDLPSNTNCENLAKLISTIHQGMCVQAKSGAGKAELLGIARIVLESNIF